MNRKMGGRGPASGVGATVSAASRGWDDTHLEAALTSLLAVGDSEGKALGELFAVGDPRCREFAIAKGRERIAGRTGQDALEALLSFQDTDPDFMDVLFAGWDGFADCDLNLCGIRGGVRFPKGLRIGGDLLLVDSGSFELPDGLQVKGSVNLLDCRIAKLPAGLRIGGDIVLEGCGWWDGVIPADARIGGRIYTDAHPSDPDARSGGGMSLRQWRKWPKSF
jgi:hypothetical protein